MAAFTPQWQRYVRSYGKGAGSASDNWVLTAHTNSYSLDLLTHEFVSDLTNEVATGNGYTSGGIALTGKSIGSVAASALTARANSTAYVLGDARRPSTANGWAYVAVVAGTSAGSAPTWPTVQGTTVADGGVTWLNVGPGLVRFTASDINQPGSGYALRYFVLSNRTPGTAATQPLLAILDLGETKNLGGGDLDVAMSVPLYL